MPFLYPYYTYIIIHIIHIISTYIIIYCFYESPLKVLVNIKNPPPLVSITVPRSPWQISFQETRFSVQLYSIDFSIFPVYNQGVQISVVFSLEFKMLIHYRGQYMDRPFEFALTFECCEVCANDWYVGEESVFYKPFLVSAVIQCIESRVGRTIGTFSPANHDFIEIREVTDDELPPDDDEWIDLTLRHVNVNMAFGRDWSRLR